MIRRIESRTAFFDAEWVPCAATLRRLYHLPQAMPEAQVFEHAWRTCAPKGEPNTKPFLKLAVSRVVAISAVLRTVDDTGLRLELVSYPRSADERVTEPELIEQFLEDVSRRDTQLVSYNGIGADLPALVQRGIMTGACCTDFCRRPAKPWEGRDYFSPNSDAHVDLMRVMAAGAFGKSVAPTLAEAAAGLGIPGKIDTNGAEVADLWLNGEYDRIISYNQVDCIVTYLLWLAGVRFCGLISMREYASEITAAQQWLASLATTQPHIAAYLVAWLNAGENVAAA